MKVALFQCSAEGWTFLFFISNLILGREFISPKVSYDTISIKKTLDKSNKEVLIIYGLLSDKITVKEFYINNKFLLGERYRFNDNKELYKFYQRSVKFDKNLEVIEDREDIFYENDFSDLCHSVLPLSG